MPRKASQAKKETAAAESKSEGGTTRRSGRAVTKQEPAGKEGKEATRSRRSSTAAQTAASVADSKTPKGRTSSRRDSTSPSDGRQKSRRESVESPATRVKSTRRSTGRVNYKESDGEEEGAQKFDETFESNEEFDDSESDEKSKSKGKGKAAKTPAKGRAAKEKAKPTRSRRGRPKKQSSDEEDNVPIELSEDSADADESADKKAKETPAAKETTRGGRTRKSRSEVTEIKQEEKPKSSRRSARASAPKEEAPKKRPSRGLQAKRYTEDDDDDDIEEIDDSKDDDATAKSQGDSGRKRKRGSATESNKRLKEEESSEKKEAEVTTIDDEEEEEDIAEKKESKPSADTENEKEQKEDSEEAMEVDASETTNTADKDSDPVETKSEEGEKKKETTKEEKIESKNIEESESSGQFKTSKEKLNLSNKQESVDSSENLDESMHSFDSDQGSRAEQSISSGLEDSQDIKETKPVEKPASQQETSAAKNVKPQVDYQPESSNSFQDLDDSSESKGLNESGTNEKKQESVADKEDSNLDLVPDKSSESLQNASNPQENKTVELEKTAVSTPVSSTPVTHSKEPNPDTSLNGSEKPLSNSDHATHSPAVNQHAEDSAPKANGAHDLHNNSVSESEQYSPFPGRKYITSSKLGENRQMVKDKSFGFVSYNLGVSSSDSSIQKEKLLNELNKLDAHIICIQQVSKSFYSGILEPSLDALGFKGTFSQPEDSEKGMATFYKSSLFRLSGQSEASLKNLIEKELEASSLDSKDKMAVRTYVKRCGHVLFTHFATVIGMHSLTVANVQVPPTDLSIHTLQVSCLVREVVRINGGTSRPFLLGGEFNMMESEASYQLLRDGYLSNDMIEELQRRKDVVLPEKENAALVNLLWKSFQHPSSDLCSCYKSILDHEVTIPEKGITSSDLLWYSSESLQTVGVLDASETSGDRHFSLKADIAFSV